MPEPPSPTSICVSCRTFWASRMLIPITAVRAGARRLGAGEFSHRIDVRTSDELEELADQFNSMAGQLQETYSDLEAKVERRTRALAQSINELKVLEEVGRAVASSLDLNAVLPTVAARALEITHADAVLIYGYDAAKRQFNLAEAIGIDRAADGAHLAIDEAGSVLGQAASQGEPVAIPDLTNAKDHILRDVAVAAGFHSVLVVPLVDQPGTLGSLVVLREVTVVFCDLRGFTAFTETTEPEEAMNVLREYHAALGELIFRYEGTLDRYAGDGVMILFNAPIQFADHTRRAVKMAVEMRDAIGVLTQKWRNRGHSLGFGVGIALGYATLGQIGFEQRLEYAAIGSVTNLASRLCDEAKANQIVVSRRVYGVVEQWVEARPIDDLSLKGFNHPVLAMEILRWREEGGAAEPVELAAARRRKQ